MSSRTTMGSRSLDIVKAWERCSVRIAVIDARRRLEDADDDVTFRFWCQDNCGKIKYGAICCDQHNLIVSSIFQVRYRLSAAVSLPNHLKLVLTLKTR
jgi:hypothetical protein